MTDAHQFFLHTLLGRSLLILACLAVSLLIATLFGWLPELQ